MSIKRTAIFSMIALSVLSILFFVYYELNLDVQDPLHPENGLASRVQILQTKLYEIEKQAIDSAQTQLFDPVQEAVRRFRTEALAVDAAHGDDDDVPLEGEPPIKDHEDKPEVLGIAEREPEEVFIKDGPPEEEGEAGALKSKGAEDAFRAELKAEAGQKLVADSATALTGAPPNKLTRKKLTTRGTLVCNGHEVDSEVIYWRNVPGDVLYESPITPHHGVHHDRYLTFEYDQGGWNNIRMGMEVFVVLAHAMGRTLVLPPQQNLYLLYKKHKGDGDMKAHSESGFEDFYDFTLLRSHEGLHVMSMPEFLEKEALVGGLNDKYPPGNSSKMFGPKLWKYLQGAADITPAWGGRYVAFPEHPDDFELVDSALHNLTDLKARMSVFGGQRTTMYYDQQMQKVHHIHFSSDREHRVLQHHYAFTFFANREMASFYKRYVRDTMRYNDEIQCAGAELVAAVRADSLATDPSQNGDYYAMHIRRGDLQFKEVKIGARQMLQNMQVPGGKPGELIFPRGSILYLSTDDPEGTCKGCYAEGKPCETFDRAKELPVGCPRDASWKAFEEAGFKLRFLGDFLKKGVLKDVNPNTLGMVESIVCSRATAFAGTYRSTFTGYIHRLRGYHGLGESTYYHSTGWLMALKNSHSVGHGFSREWRAGWTDDEGGLI